MIITLYKQKRTTCNHSGYNNALKDAEERYKEAEAEYNAKYEEVKELHKMKVLKQITDETFKQAKEELDKQEEKVRDIGYEIEQIEGYKREDKEEVLAKLNEIKGEYNKKKQEEVRRIQLQLLKAKLEYFKKLTGEVLHQTSSCKQEDFLSFLQLVANHYKDQLIAMVVDNAKIHRSQLIQDFLAKNERILYLPLYHLI